MEKYIRSKKQYIFLFVLFYLFFQSILISDENQNKLQFQNDESLKYKLKVNAYIIPLFATNKKNEPVFDLKKSDLKLFINDKETSIDYLIGYQKEFIQNENKQIQQKTIASKSFIPRSIFIILDSIFNSKFGIKRMKKISEELILQGEPNDQFYIIGMDSFRGLFLIAGPERSSLELINKIEKVKLYTTFEEIKRYDQKRHGQSYMDVENQEVIYDEKSYDSGDYYDGLLKTSERYLAELEMENGRITQNFLKSIFDLRMAFSTIINPKVVYLFSEGIMEGSLLEQTPLGAQVNSYYISRINEIVSLFNQMGVTLFTVNPGRIEASMSQTSGKLSLQILAYESGGEYFAGTETKTLINRIKNTTSAYYELAFSKDKRLGIQKSVVKIETLRDDLKIFVPKQVMDYKLLSELNEDERELYILNVIEGGSWSKMIGKVSKTEYKIIEKTNDKMNTRFVIEVDLPKELSNDQTEVYIVHINVEKKAMFTTHQTFQVKDKLALTIEAKKDEKIYFVIHQSQKGLSLYNKIN